MTFEDAIIALSVAGTTAVAQVGNYQLVRFNPDGIIESWKTTALEEDPEAPRITALSRGTCDGRETPSYVVFGTTVAEQKGQLNVWIDGAVVRIELGSEPLSICHSQNGFIFVAEEKKISVFKFSMEKNSLKRICEKEFEHWTKRMWLAEERSEYVLYILTKYENGYQIYANGLLVENYEPMLTDKISIQDPFIFMCSTDSGEPIFFDHYGPEIHVRTYRPPNTSTYHHRYPLREVIHWKHGLILQFENGHPAIVTGKKNLGEVGQWKFLKTRKYREVAVLGNFLLLSRGWSVSFHKLPE